MQFSPDNSDEDTYRGVGSLREQTWILRWPTETRTTGNCYLPGGGGGVFRSEPGESRAGPQMMRFPVAAVDSRDEAPAKEMESGKKGTREKHPNHLFSLS